MKNKACMHDVTSLEKTPTPYNISLLKKKKLFRNNSDLRGCDGQCLTSDSSMVESEQSKSRQLAELEAALQRNRREAEVLQWKIGQLLAERAEDQLVAERAEDRQHIEQEPASVVECNYSSDPDLQDAICLPGSPTTCSLGNSSADQVEVGVDGGAKEKLDTPLHMPIIDGIKSTDLLVKGIGGGLSVKKAVASMVGPIRNLLLIQNDPKAGVCIGEKRLTHLLRP